MLLVNFFNNERSGNFMKISQLPRPAQQVLEIIYQQYLLHNYVEKPIQYSLFDCSKTEISGPLDVLKKYDFLKGYILSDSEFVYKLSANGISSCESSAEFKTSALLIDLNVPAEDWMLISSLISEIDNLGFPVIDRKYKIKEQLIKLINTVDAEPLAEVLSELLCH